MVILNICNLQPKNIFVVLGLLISILSACEKTKIIDPNLDPNIGLTTGAVTIISSNQIKMIGEIKNLNKEEIQDIGFMLYDQSDGASNPREISLGKKEVKVGTIEYTFTSSTKFEIGREYAYTLYVKTLKGFYKGEIVKFSVDLIKTDIEQVNKVVAGKSFTLEGDFSQMESNYYLTITTEDYYSGTKTIKLPYEIGKDTKVLKIEAPKNHVYHGRKYDIILNSQSKNGNNPNKRILSKIQILANIDTPKVNEIYIIDELPISGYALPIDPDHDLKITIADKTLPFAYGMRITDFELNKLQSYTWSYDNGTGSKEFPENLVIKTPKSDQIIINRYAVHPYQSLFISEFNFRQYFGDEIEKITIGNKEYPKVDIYNNALLIDLGDLPVGEHDITFSSSIFDVKLAKKLKVIPFKLESISKTTVYPNDPITFKGSFIKDEFYSLTTEDFFTAFGAYAISDSEVVINCQDMPAGTYNLNFAASSIVANKNIVPLKITVLPPEISSLSSTTIKSGETLTINGKGLANIGWVEIGGFYNFISKSTNEELQVRISHLINPGKYPINLISNRGYNTQISTNKTIEVL